MKINQKQQSRQNRHSYQSYQLCRLLSSFPHRQIQNQRNQSEFDDKYICHTPQTHLNQKNKELAFKQELQAQALRKQRIKLKIKNQVRQKIRKLTSKQLTYKKSTQLQVSTRSNIQSVQPKSQYFHARSPDKIAKINQIIMANCVIQPLQLHEKIVGKRHSRMRSRLVQNMLENRPHVRTSLNQRATHLSKMKMSTPNLQNPQGLNQKLQPWRYSDEVQMEQTFFKKINRIN